MGNIPQRKVYKTDTHRIEPYTTEDEKEKRKSIK